MNQTLQVIEKRYSCRHYSDEMPTNEQLEHITRAALCAPSAVNRQPWQIVLVKNRGLIDEIQEEAMKILSQMEDPTGYNRIMERGGLLFYNAPCMLIIARPEDGSLGTSLDVGIVSSHIALAAAAEGLGNVICGFAALAFAGDKKEYFEKKLGFYDGYVFGMSVLTGHALQTASPHTPDESKLSVIE
ncbi:MAG: nitroreductase family protein [Lachnospiraceae bacterium]